MISKKYARMKRSELNRLALLADEEAMEALKMMQVLDGLEDKMNQLERKLESAMRSGE